MQANTSTSIERTTDSLRNLVKRRCFLLVFTGVKINTSERIKANNTNYEISITIFYTLDKREKGFSERRIVKNVVF